jgi:hypothetical protein
MTKRILYFILLLAVLLVPIFFVHYYFLGAYQTVLLKSYWVNYLMAVAIYVALVLASKKHNSQLGFLYMGGSFFKFIIYFLVLNPIFKTIDVSNKITFIMFFVPYAVAIILETKLLINLLNASDKPQVTK